MRMCDFEVWINLLSGYAGFLNFPFISIWRQNGGYSRVVFRCSRDDGFRVFGSRVYGETFPRSM